jgi:hypothetical protein
MRTNGAFWSIGNASAPKGRSPYSLFFTAAHLPQFELADDDSDRARVMDVNPKSDTGPRQLSLPFTEWILYQGITSSLAGAILTRRRARNNPTPMQWASPLFRTRWHPCFISEWSSSTGMVRGRTENLPQDTQQEESAAKWEDS